MRVRPVSIRACAISILAAVVFGSVPAVAAQTADVQALRQEIEQLRQELEAVQQQYAERLSALEARLGAGDVPAPVAPAPVAPVTSQGIFNPDIGVIGNFVGAAGSSQGGSDTLAPLPFATLQESEVSLQAIIDPYARADFFLDPWNSPYWIQHDCSRRSDGELVMVYSFGPNRRRESTEWEVGGDDIAAIIEYRSSASPEVPEGR